jgi:hypothetical protein
MGVSLRACAGQRAGQKHRLVTLAGLHRRWVVIQCLYATTLARWVEVPFCTARQFYATAGQGYFYTTAVLYQTYKPLAATWTRLTLPHTDLCVHCVTIVFPPPPPPSPPSGVGRGPAPLNWRGQNLSGPSRWELAWRNES